MNRKNSAHSIVVESLTQALLILMEKKPLKEIKISELCKKAGVGRVSFYRNYSSMEEILVHYLKKCTDDWWVEFSKKPQDEFYASFWDEHLNEYRKNERLITLIYENNASHIIKEHIFACCRAKTPESEESSYLRAALAGALYGMVDEWIRLGMGDFPEKFSLRSIVRLMP